MKSIPIALQSHYDGDATTTCLLTRIETKDGTVLGFTDLDADLIYDDGDGDVTYRADNGFTPSRLQASADTAVDNAELEGVVSESGITMAQIRAGLFNRARVRIYRVNYLDLSQGHEIVAAGTAGETKFSASGWKTEFRSLTQQLRQPLSPAYSIDCRAQFGSKAIGTGDGSYEERHPCGKDFTWTAATVTGLGSNAKRTIVASGLAATGDFYSPGVVRVTSGANAGHEMEVDDYDGATKTITLALSLPFAFAEDDEIEIRQDCSKIARDETHGCKYHWGAEWIHHIQGEPDIPVSDGGANMIPGAQITQR
jgi:uncharacterized phage protein (TIGR02218 family)